MKRWTVGDVMTRDVVWVPENATYHDIIGEIAAHHISAVPVLGTDHQVVGVVSEADLLRKVELGDEHRVFLRPSRRAAQVKSLADYASDLMSAPAITAGPEMSLTQAAQIMARHHVKRLIVVTDGKLQGIVSRTDLLKGYLRDDADIRRDIVDGVLRESMWIDPDGVAVSVSHGSVDLGGEMDRKSTAQIVAYLCGLVPGVIDVHNGLSWRFNDTNDASTGYFRSHPFSTMIIHQ